MLELYWTTCSCGAVHARNACPMCQAVAVGKPVEVTRIDGKVKVTVLFAKHQGLILYATVQDGDLKYLYHDGQDYRREDGMVAIQGPLDRSVRFRIHGDETLLGKSGLLVTAQRGKILGSVGVDSYLTLPIFDANSQHRFWLQGGHLTKNTVVAGMDQQEVIGDVLRDQTLIWAGPKFGFGFYRAGQMSVAFVFDSEHRGINDAVKVPVKGTILDSTCAFTEKLCWFFYTAKVQSRIMNYAFVVTRRGEVVATAEAEKGSEPWLDNIRGKWAFQNGLFTATDDGLKRMEVNHGRIELAVEFADTEHLVDSSDCVFLGKAGLYVASGHQISLLQIK